LQESNKYNKVHNEICREETNTTRLAVRSAGIKYKKASNQICREQTNTTRLGNKFAGIKYTRLAIKYAGIKQIQGSQSNLQGSNKYKARSQVCRDHTNTRTTRPIITPAGIKNTTKLTINYAGIKKIQQSSQSNLHGSKNTTKLAVKSAGIKQIQQGSETNLQE
jgi:hypothetical protein